MTALAVVPPSSSVRPYGLPAQVEAALAYRLACSPRLWGLVGEHIEEEALADERVRLLVRACRLHAKDAGKGPDSITVPLARLARLREQGKVTEAQIASVVDLLDAVEDSGQVPGDEAIAAEVGPILRRRRESEILQEMMRRYAQHGDLSRLVSDLARVQRIGVVEVEEGTRLTGEVFETIDRLRHIDRLSTGVYELDFVLDGGMGRSQLGVVMGDAKAGKSVFLTNLAASAVLHGLNVAVATLELDETTWAARLISNLTGVPVAPILRGQWAPAKAALEQIQATRAFGQFVVREFPPGATTVGDVHAWLDLLVERGFQYDVVVIDYADRMGSARKDANSYDTGREVYDGLRYWAVERKCWVWTASQTKAGSHSGMDKLADSRHKSRILDLCVELRPSDDRATMEYHVAGNRHGRTGDTVGPVETDFARARCSPDVARLLGQ